MTSKWATILSCSFKIFAKSVNLKVMNGLILNTNAGFENQTYGMGFKWELKIENFGPKICSSCRAYYRKCSHLLTVNDRLKLSKMGNSKEKSWVSAYPLNSQEDKKLPNSWFFMGKQVMGLHPLRIVTHLSIFFLSI